jgi:site-specific DNA-methyltransferase (adenine-specific)
MILMQGDCLKMLEHVKSGSVDMVLTDPPYGTTACKWDSIIPLEPMWEQLKRIIKPNGAIVMTASQPFTTKLIASNMKMFKYCWVWQKSKATGHLNSKKRPLVKHEDIVVFSKSQPKYNPQGLLKKDKPTISKGNRGLKGIGSSGDVYGLADKDAIQTHSNYPKSIIEMQVERKPIHPTQKPVALMEYLIKTYTNEGDTVLDFAMGSGTTGVACENLGRDFIGIELDESYFETARKRISEAQQ